ncbi:SDR family oxidoreductase [Agrococcus sp. ARC_14]|uniref:SDR family NAD(P)-dependent oxidoreductase n=1 Tax=Agrococcus sp. ARC_14 TaxID=2919927 RepID=UPI001F06AC37|nr:SDR family oxidoreductase [Agrococcus sp. ARC_14]MCH1883869.1 SDR family oxidoreductase [Agrococcus sp. ARC_14]
MRHVLITGAGSGIGRAIALAFAELGEALTLVDVDAASLEQTADAARASGAPRCDVLVVDLREPGAAAQVLASTWSSGPVDVLVSSAGVYPATPFLELDERVWDLVLGVNTRAPVLLTVELAKRAIEAGRPASVVNISSGAALRARPGAAPYSTSKAALEAATRASALELGRHGIRVNAVSPGFVEVDSAVNPVTDEYADAVGDTPLGRRGRPADIAKAVVWLASSEAEWITGEVLRVDGGSSTGAWNLPQHWSAIDMEEQA